MNRIALMSLVVPLMPFCVVVVDVFSAMGGVLPAYYHGERAQNCYSGNRQIDTNPIVITSSFHSVTSINQDKIQIYNRALYKSILVHLRDERGNVCDLFELPAPHEQSLFKWADLMTDLICA